MAGLALASPGDSTAPVSARTQAEPILQARTGERLGARAAEFDGLSIVLAVLALLILVGWRRRDRVLH